MLADQSNPKLAKKACDALFARGERLGFAEGTTYVAETFQLEDNDVVLLYTDGITEAKGRDGSLFGERALKKIFLSHGLKSLSEIKLEIAEKVNQHQGDALQEDDITFLLFSWRSRLAKAA